MMEDLNKLTPDPVPLTVLSPSLLRTFKTISGGARNVFKRLYIAVWNHLVPVSRLDSVVMCYPVNSILNHYNKTLPVRLTPLHWFALCRLWVLTGAGSTAVNSLTINIEPNGERKRIAGLVRCGFLIRTTFNPLAPHAVRPFLYSRTFISFTPSGIRFVRGVLGEIHKAIRNDLFDSFKPE